MDFLCVCIRIPKSGSVSLAHLMETAFEGRRMFYLPHTLDLDGPVSSFQQWRFARTQIKNLFAHYRTARIDKAYSIIAHRAHNGDLIRGGHIDLPNVRRNIDRKVKAITLFRNPVERCLSEYYYCRQTYYKKFAFLRFDAGVRHKAAARYDFTGYLDFLLERRTIYGDMAARYIGWNGEDSLPAFFDEHVFHSGVIERKADFVRELSEKLGRAVSLPHMNRTRNRPPGRATQAQRTKIEHLHPRDFALFEWQNARN